MGYWTLLAGFAESEESTDLARIGFPPRPAGRSFGLRCGEGPVDGGNGPASNFTNIAIVGGRLLYMGKGIASAGRRLAGRHSQDQPAAPESGGTGLSQYLNGCAPGCLRWGAKTVGGCFYSFDLSVAGWGGR